MVNFSEKYTLKESGKQAVQNISRAITLLEKATDVFLYSSTEETGEQYSHYLLSAAQLLLIEAGIDNKEAIAYFVDAFTPEDSPFVDMDVTALLKKRLIEISKDKNKD